ncbi:MAG: protease modulator HflC, partial [SAR202 cluster bacterium]|nr:protease modulator HflC [SAR202 cluster bacterium]
MKILVILIVMFAILGAIFVPQFLYIVDETQVAVLTRFGEPRKQIMEPGLYTKTPFAEQVTYLDKRLLIFDALPDSLITKDKKRLVIDVYARGRIINPLLFVETVRTETQAVSRAVDILTSELRVEIARDDQSEIIQTSREAIMLRVRDAVAPKLLDFGIEIVDVRIKRADFPGEIANSVYERMKAERKRIADRERAQGAKADLEKRSNVDRVAVEIRSAATRDADIIRGCGEAESIAIFAAALNLDPEFFTFQRSLETYRAYFNENTTIVGSAQDLGQIFEDVRKALNESVKAPDVISDATIGDTALESSCEEVQAVTAARTLLANDLDTEPRALIIQSTDKVDWANSAIGCEEAGVSYAQV